MSKVILECKDLHKKFGKKEILKGISLKLYEGDILGFIGPNGAGKTTIIKLILGLQNITSGTVLINGHDIEKDFVNAIEQVGAIVENPDFYMYLTGRKNLELAANMYKGIKKDRIDEVVKLVGLEKRINDKVSKYSLGMRQRLGIAEALLHHPNLLILDEPTNGLDPEGIKDLRDLLKKLAKDENITIFISSHILSEIENLCTKICIIKNGKVVETTEMSELKHSSRNLKYIITVDDTSKLKKISDNMKILDNHMFEVLCNKEEIPDIIKNLVEEDIRIYIVNEKVTTLEEAFLKKTGGNTID
ncbi:MAG TPA: ABC transporter ATP-binding protein [Bacilli bacterium]|nr:ABC transporter ATP-binding protein [Bacilli bacterium]